jgi:hypothetical protein
MAKLGKEKKRLKDRVQEILAGLEPGDRIVNPDDDRFMRDLLEKHPSKDSKIGVGVKAFFCLAPDRENMKRPGH